MGAKPISRRNFLRSSIAAATIAAPNIVPSRAFGANSRITIGCIGVGSQGSSNMGAFLGIPDVQVIAVCDVDAARRDGAQARVNERYGNSDCAAYADFREIIERKDIDAVSIGTPDHWHAIATIRSARAGKDIYCEKPLSLTIAEGRAMANAVHRYGRVLQTGTWRRSRPMCRLACELVRSGRIGQLHTVKIGVPQGYAIRGGDYAGLQPRLPVPDGFDYERWLGPAPWAPYTPARCHFNFRWIMDYSEGYISDWGAHYYDIGQWCIGSDRTGPVSIEGQGTFPKDGLYDAPTDHRITFTYANGVNMVSIATADASQWGMRFEGSEGWIQVESDSIQSEPESIAKSPLGPNDVHLYKSDNHHINFVQCIRSRGETAAPVEIAHRSASVCHLGTIAVRLGRGLNWDPDMECFVGDEKADRLLSRAMRAPWSI